VVFGEVDGMVGTGCIREVTDAVFLGLPVWAFDGGRLVELIGFEFLPEQRRTARQAATHPVRSPALRDHAGGRTGFDGPPSKPVRRITVVDARLDITMDNLVDIQRL
jgi:hypothetical protein